MARLPSAALITGDPRAVSCIALAVSPPLPPPPGLRAAFQASRWGRGSGGGEEESRKGYFLTLHILQVEHFVRFSLCLEKRLGTERRSA